MSSVTFILIKAFDGYNVSIFAYGQTGSGKTYSMIGTSECPGLIPRFFDALFEKREKRQAQITSHIEISYYEIYNEKIFDLLRPSTDPAPMTKGFFIFLLYILIIKESFIDLDVNFIPQIFSFM